MFNTLTIAVVVLLVLVVGDGVRRYLINRRNRIDVSPALKKRLRASDQDDGDYEQPTPSYVSELPNGGARIVAHRDTMESSQRERKPSARELKEQRRREEIANRTPEQTRLNLDEAVPILMESVEHHEDEVDSLGHDHRIEPTLEADDTHEYEDHHADDEDDYLDEEERDEDDLDEEDLDEEELDEDYDTDEYEDEESEEDFDETESEDEAVQPKSAAPQADPEEVLIINIMAAKGEVFSGTDLLDIVLKCGLRYGDMDIFHRYSDTKGDGALLFSMANMVRPGTFDLDAMDEFSTPGISLFMTLPIEAESMQSFDLMVETAQAISQTLHGELKDEQRSAMTRQTLDHARQRIQDFERKKLFRRPR